LHIGRPAPSYAEAERYSAAEYTFFELPHRFQHYVSEYLAPDERILYAARRPAMPSQRNRSWLRREYLQAGVLILTNQRLIHLAELVPPDSANIRYGFHTSIGVVERLMGISVSTLGNESLLLSTKWNARGGSTSIEWEMPAHALSSLDELTTLLEKFVANDSTTYQLRRAGIPKAPDRLPPLIDTASGDPESLLPINEHFSAALMESLQADERAYAWALLPEWLDRKKGAQVVVVTERRIFVLPDHSMDIPLEKISTWNTPAPFWSLPWRLTLSKTVNCAAMLASFPTQPRILFGPALRLRGIAWQSFPSRDGRGVRGEGKYEAILLPQMPQTFSCGSTVS
jgi:hypothetical protein